MKHTQLVVGTVSFDTFRKLMSYKDKAQRRGLQDTTKTKINKKKHYFDVIEKATIYALLCQTQTKKWVILIEVSTWHCALNKQIKTKAPHAIQTRNACELVYKKTKATKKQRNGTSKYYYYFHKMAPE